MRNNPKLRKALTLILCAVALVAISVGATIAYLTDHASVKNTFSVGHVDITLDEAKTDIHGDKDGEVRITGLRDGEQFTNKYHLIPGEDYLKDPTITIKQNSEECYVVAKIVVSGAEDSPLVYGKGTASELLGLNYKDDAISVISGGAIDALPVEREPEAEEAGVFSWTGTHNDYGEITFTQSKSGNAYTFMVYFEEPFEKETAGNTSIVLFDKLYIPKAFTNTQIQTLDDLTIDVTAYAMQESGFDDVFAAYKACEEAGWDPEYTFVN